MPYNGQWGNRPPGWGQNPPGSQPPNTGFPPYYGGGRPQGPPGGTGRPPANTPPIGSDPAEQVPPMPPGGRPPRNPWGLNPGMRPGARNPGTGWPGQNPPPNQPPPAGPPAATKHPMFGGGRASPITMPDGTTAWIWNGKVYPYDPTAPENNPLLEDRNPFAPPWDPGQAS